MKIRNFILSALFFGLVLNFALSLSLDAQEKEEETAQEPTQVIIPFEVKSAIQEGITTRQGIPDIPFVIIKYYYFPAQQNVHSVFLFKLKNANLDFQPIIPAPEDLEEKPEEEKEETPPPESESPAAKLQANSLIFLQFNSLENNELGEIVKEVYIPVKIEIESSSYKPEQEDIYTTGYPLPPGNYLLSMAITSSDLSIIGTQYFEFSLPDATSFSDRLDTTPILFVKGIERMASPETRAEVHKDFFTYSILQMKPNIENIFSVGENLDIFFFVFGAQPTMEGKYNLEVNYEVLKGENQAIRYAKTYYEAPVISQPLPPKKTVIIKSEKEGESKEIRDLEPGQYTLSINIKDMVTGNSVGKKIDFEVI